MRKSIATGLATLASLIIGFGIGSVQAAPVTFGLVPGAERASGPPYPIDNVEFDMHGDPLGGTPIGTLLFHVDGASSAADPAFPLTISTSLSRGGVVSFGLQAPPDPEFPMDITIDPCWDVNPLAGSTPSLIDPPITAQEGDGSVDVLFNISMADGSVTKMRAHLTMGAGQPFTFGDVTAVLGSSIDTSLHLLLDPNGVPDAGSPLFTVEFTGEFFAPEPGALALFGLGLAAFGVMRRRRPA